MTTRRSFVKNAALAGASVYIVPRHVLGRGYVAPSDKLVIAGIGAGGKGGDDINQFYASGKAEIGFICDVDERQAVENRKKFPKALFYKDFREMLERSGKSIDAVSVGIPDHQHAVAAMAAMKMGKHVYVQKPLTHDIYEARMLTQAAHQYKVVTQMGNQGASGDGVRQLVDWYKAGIVGDIHTIYCFTDRPIWPQGIVRPATASPIPAGLDYDLWLGTAPDKPYFDGQLPFNWRGWWDYGTGALGDMACHIMAPAFAILGLGYPVSAECSVATPYVQNWGEGYFPDSCPIASHITLTFKNPDVTLHWMDGGIQPTRPTELLPNEVLGDGGNGAIFYGTKGNMMCATYGKNPSLLPTSRSHEVTVPQTVARVPGGDEGHYKAWVEAAIAGYGIAQAKALSSNFDIAGPLTESVLMGNLAIRSFGLRKKAASGDGFDYPGRHIKLLWDGASMKVTNFDEANEFVRRGYRGSWTL
ncbi:MAG TPA: Gfo/Idh/MocA family oxidoreductase [Dinghuibacter sp.]|uniref:Gfo/Idh/MocA family protein n=1 Tax=Dinghuibacter sp. TaxID=2024697 RepID=UPI002CCA479F|nr:Gfo/Idh/MocA family oxidoreductase [Dinghuibacter sp.]HTJ12291.1 Gfo/Idh/MocA family oxidoreductase [Dinghuibacter sp.]